MSDHLLAQALLDFAHAPGRHSLRLRQPARVFAHFDTVAQWAMGRIPPALAAQDHALTRAAVMFVQRACFAPHNTHYQVLGLTPGPIEPEKLRTRYRILIRLTHPDMGVAGLPKTAAGWVNRAQAILADPALRAQYDAEMANWNKPKPRALQAKRQSTAPTQRAKRKAALPAALFRLSTRWKKLWARNPAIGRKPLMAVVASMAFLSLLLLLVWAASDEHSGASLIAKSDHAHHSAIAENPAALAARMKARTEAGAPQRLSANAATALEVPLASTKRAQAPAPAPAPAAAGAAPSARQITPSPPSPPLPDTLATLAARASPSGNGTASLQTVVTGTAQAHTEAVAMEQARWPTSQHTAATASPSPATATERSHVAQGGAASGDADRHAVTVATVAVPPPAEPAPVAQARKAIAPRATFVPETAAQHAASVHREALAAVDQPIPAHPASTDAVPNAARVTAIPVGAAPTLVLSRAIPAAAAIVMDGPGSVKYLEELLQSFENPSDARNTNDLLVAMNVKGNLLAPGLQMLGRYQRVRLASLALSQTPRAGAIDVVGSVVLRGTNTRDSEDEPLRYRVSATFVARPEGAALSRLNLSEDR